MAKVLLRARYYVPALRAGGKVLRTSTAAADVLKSTCSAEGTDDHTHYLTECAGSEDPYYITIATSAHL